MKRIEKVRQVAKEQVFISYSHKDKKWREELEKHLKPFLRNSIITRWSDQQIAPGSEWFKEIRSALANSKVAVLLVSPDFLDSDFIDEHEFGPLLKGAIKILWVPLRASGYKQTPLKYYQAVLDPNKPLANMTEAERDQAWVEICEEIQKTVCGTKEPRQSPNDGREQLASAPHTIRARLEELSSEANNVGDDGIWAAEVKRLLDAFLGPGVTNLHSEAYWEFAHAKSHSERTGILRAVLSSHQAPRDSILARLKQLSSGADTVGDSGEAQQIWAAEVKRLLDAFLGPGATNLHSEAYWEFAHAKGHSERTGILRAVLFLHNAGV